MEEQQHAQDFEKLDIRDMLNWFINRGIKVKIQYISGHWVDVNNISDLTSASEF
jgi:NDP-sugar pyrophosphorylase family protein